MERIAVKIPKGRSCRLCGGGPVTVIVYSRIGRVTLDEPCVARIMGSAYDGGPKKEALHDAYRTASEEGRVLAPRVAIATPPKPPSLTDTLRASAFAKWPRPRARASPRIVDGGTQIGHIIAWRIWGWKDGRLLGVGVPAAWAEREAKEAVCEPSQGHTHKTSTLLPAWGCACGYHALQAEPFKGYLRDVLRGDQKDARYIIGTVALWGRVVTHQDGYRAQYAYPLQCFAEMRRGAFRPLARQTADALKRRYGVLIGSPEEAALLLYVQPGMEP